MARKAAKSPARVEPKERWIRTYLAERRECIETAAGAELMPVLTRPSLGCGSYGCVFSTRTPGWVLKASFDGEEGKFILRTGDFRRVPDGIANYSLVIEHPDVGADPGTLAIDPHGFEDVLYLLWREEALFGPDDRLTKEERDTTLRVYEQMQQVELALRTLLLTSIGNELPEVMHNFRNIDDPWRLAHEYGLHTSDDALARAALMLLAVPKILQAEPPSRLCHVWRAIEYYARHGLLLPDAHFGNIAAVRRNGREIFVIIDPSLVVDFEHLLKPASRRSNPLPRSRPRTPPRLASEDPGRNSIRARAVAPRSQGR